MSARQSATALGLEGQPGPVQLPGGSQGRHLALATVLLLSLGLNLWGAGWGLPNDKSWSNDDPTPEAALAIGEIWTEGWHKYPYLLPWLDRALYAPQLAAWRADGSLSSAPECRPPTDDDCFADVHAQYGRLMWVSRTMRAVMGAGIVLAVYVLALSVAPGAAVAAIVAAAAAAFSQVLVFYSQVGNVDVPMTFFFAWSLVAWQHAVRGGGLASHAAFGALGGAALACKEPIYGAYMLPGLALVALAWRSRTEPSGAASKGARRRASVRAWAGPIIAGLAVLLVYSLGLNALGNPAGFREHVAYWTAGTGIAPWNEGFSGYGALATTFLRRLAEATSLPLLAVAAGGATFALRRPRARWLLLPATSYLLFTIATVRFAYTRFTLPVVVVLAVLAGVGWADAWAAPLRVRGRPGPYRAFLGLAVAFALAHGLLYSLHTVRLMRDDARYAAEAWLVEHVPPGATIAVYGSRTHLPRLRALGLERARIDEADFDAAGFAAREDGPPTWLLLSEKNLRGLDGEAAAWRDALLDGKTDYEVVLDARGRSGLEPWLIGAWTESRVSPRTWVLRRRAVGEAKRD